MALFGVGRGRARDREAVPGPAVLTPRRSLDGWTLEDTPLSRRFGREELRELATLMHGVSAGMETAWTYERAADMLEEAGERPQALAVLDAYFLLPHHIRQANSSTSRTLARRRHRLRKRLGTAPWVPADPDAPAIAGPLGPEGPKALPAPTVLALPPAPAGPPPLPSAPGALALPPAPDYPPPSAIPPKPTRPALPVAPPEPRR